MNDIKASDVAIVVPLFLREYLTEAEKISYNHLKKHLNGYDTYLVAAEGLMLDELGTEGCEIKRFPKKFFGSIDAYIRLTSSKKFYTAFKNYKYIFIYHFDALVFSDQLLQWCNKGYDVVAPPWFKGDAEWIERDLVGNSGFCIRKVDTFIKLYSSKKYWLKPLEFAKLINKKVPSKILKAISFPIWLLASRFLFLNNHKMHIRYYISQKKAEDLFIARFGHQYLPDLHIIPAQEAIKFGFEMHPQKYYAQNNNQLPFGCHDYEKYDKEFWEPFLIK